MSEHIQSKFPTDQAKEVKGNAYGYVDGCKARQSGMLGGEGFPDNIESRKEKVTYE